jgi:hypothetical protein
MTKLAIDTNAKPIQVVRPTTAQNVSISGAAASASAVTTRVCRIVSTVDCFYSLVGTATTASTFIPAYTIEFVHTYDGDVFSVITSGTSGTFNITQMI